MILVQNQAAAKQVADGLAQGKSFAALASEFSTDPTKSRGGFLGRVALKDLNEQVRAMVGSLKIGGYTGPVRVPNGLAFFQRTTTAHYTEALELMRAEKYEEALKPLAEDLALNPDRIHSLSLQAYALQRLNRSKEAQAIYRTIIQQDPKNVLAYNNLGTLLDQEGQYAEAAKMFEEAIKLDPKQDVTLHNLAWIYFSRLNDPAKAQSYIQRAIALKPTSANYYAMLGNIYRRMDRREEARIAMAKAVELDPRNPELKQFLAQLEGGGPSKPPAAAAPPPKENPSPPPLASPPQMAPREKTASVVNPSVPAIKVVTRTGGAKTTQLVQDLLRRNGFPVKLRYREAKPLQGIRIYYKPESAGPARKIRNLITPRPELRKLSWNSEFDIIVFVGN